MSVVTIVVCAFLALSLTLSAVGKLTRQAAVVQVMESVHFPVERMWVLGVLELAGAAGLVVGLFWTPIGVAAAIGVVLYFLGAVVSHLRVHDLAGTGPAAGLLVLAIASLVLLLTS